MKKLSLIVMFTLLSSVLNISCSKDSPTESGIEISESGDTITITDRTGKIWDITYAVSNYGMEPNRFNFGNGPFSFKPYTDPQFFESGQTGYPAASATTPVIGVTLNGESRAYPISAFIGREVIDDRFGTTYVAVTY